MEKAPPIIGKARTIAYLVLSDEFRGTGNTKHFIDGALVKSFASLAICQYLNDSGYYLFYCDSNWNALTDTYHDTIEGAVEQAEYEFRGSSSGWTFLRDDGA
ncbi:hypothetical protein [Flaviaesturariibacter terrae]